MIAYKYQGDNYNYCAECGHVFWFGEMVFYSRHEPARYICQKCSEKELETHMPNIKITAEVDGKQVPLKTVSIETFEAIKALEKQEEIPVARIAEHGIGRRLIFKVTKSMAERVNRYVAISLESGSVAGHWPEDDGDCGSRYGYNYENVRPI